jgi:hypothetical protein
VLIVPLEELDVLKESRKSRVELLRGRNWSCDCVECRSSGARQPDAVFVFASRIIKCMHYQRVEHATPPKSLEYGYPRCRGRSSRLYSLPYPTKGWSYTSQPLCYGTILMTSPFCSLSMISFLERPRPIYVYGLLAITVAFLL